MRKIQELSYWNTRTYGNAFKIEKKWLMLGFITLCIVTPFTNWLIPFVGKIISCDFIIRF